MTTPYGKLKIVCKAIMPQKTETRNIPIVVSEEVTFRITGSLLISEDKKIKTKKLLKAIDFMNKMHMCGDKEKWKFHFFMETIIVLSLCLIQTLIWKNMIVHKSLHITLKKTFRNCYLFWHFHVSQQKRTLTWMKNK